MNSTSSRAAGTVNQFKTGDKAEREIRRDEATAEPKLDAIPEAKSEAKT